MTFMSVRFSHTYKSVAIQKTAIFGNFVCSFAQKFCRKKVPLFAGNSQTAQTAYFAKGNRYAHIRTPLLTNFLVLILFYMSYYIPLEICTICAVSAFLLLTTLFLFCKLLHKLHLL